MQTLIKLLGYALVSAGIILRILIAMSLMAISIRSIPDIIQNTDGLQYLVLFWVAVFVSTYLAALLSQLNKRAKGVDYFGACWMVACRDIVISTIVISGYFCLIFLHEGYTEDNPKKLIAAVALALLSIFLFTA